MGQPIDVIATTVGDVAIFDLDRSLTGQDSRTFRATPPGDSPPEILARRLWDRDPEVSSVHIFSNTVTIARNDGWDEHTIGKASDVIANLFVHYGALSPDEREDELRQANYNATITSIRAHNPDLWVLWIKPDEPIEPFKAGQYTTLALGYWEPRVDDAIEDFEANPQQRYKMARRSYSVSSSMIDEDGELLDPHPAEVEFYVVLVRPDEDEIPALTPRMFAKTAGDRIYMSRKFTGRYTLDGVESSDNVVFLSTGTGEAPQNRMTAELLRNEHEGKIISVVCVRYRQDLAYTEQQAVLTDRYPNYKYLVLTTREPENKDNKVYIQDLVQSGRLEEELGAPLDPANTHVFLCGNPAMIGLPNWDDDAGTMEFPETLGMCQILHERGFTIDHRKERGNVHYEEYWKDR
jgi:ferredoxin--NADP+ reductase